MSWRIKITVPVFYTDPDSVADNISYIPMFDQDYSLKINFPKTGRGLLSYSGQLTVNYDTAYDIDPIYEYTYNWSGLTEAEKDVFVSFIDNFNNSFQKFNFQVQLDGSPQWNMDCVVNSNSLTIKKDRLDLYSITIPLIKL